MGNDKTSEFTIYVKDKPIVKVTDKSGQMDMQDGYDILLRFMLGLPLIDDETEE